MARYHSVTWQDENFAFTAAVLSFNSKAARAAYPAQCAQRVEEIDCKRKNLLLKTGCAHALMLWDEKDPATFVTVQ
jgi:hypothetical protein